MIPINQYNQKKISRQQILAEAFSMNHHGASNTASGSVAAIAFHIPIQQVCEV